MISIIIPAYNRIASLKQCIDSIVSQYYEGLEIIIIDDCSSDGTGAWLKEQFSTHPFIRIILNAKNKGVNYSRNRGIELASKPYILFIDSDDSMVAGSLQYVTREIEKNPTTTHFLFLVSDRITEFNTMTKSRRVWYSDWVSGRVNGDFTHVISSKIMKQYLFFEQFRMYEHLNWLRVKKTTSPQQMIPIVVADRERNRADCLTNAMKLRDVNVIKSKFEAEKIYYSMYYADLREHNPRSLSNQLLEAIALGTACNQKEESRLLVQYASKFHVRFLSGIILQLPSSFIKYGIIKYSAYKSRKAN